MTDTDIRRSLHGQAGLIGKIAMLWIVGLLLAGLLILDGISIVLTTFKLSSTAQAAATTAATTFKNTHDATAACLAAEPDLLHDNQSVPTSDTWCRVNESTGVATISLHSTASSLVLSRLSFTQDLTKISVKETAEAAGL